MDTYLHILLPAAKRGKMEETMVGCLIILWYGGIRRDKEFILAVEIVNGAGVDWEDIHKI